MYAPPVMRGMKFLLVIHQLHHLGFFVPAW